MATFQAERHQVIRQQAILKAMGLYTGHIDGVWASESIAAKKRLENQPAKLKPARPNNGLPFDIDQPLPAGITFNRSTGLLESALLTEDIIQEEKEALSGNVRKAKSVSKQPPAKTESEPKPAEQGN